MSTKSSVSLERAGDFIWRNARLLERNLFAHRFIADAQEQVRASVLAYRNPDGGFGNAMEPDVRAPSSAALHCEIALRSFHLAGLRDASIASGVCEFLVSIAQPDGRVPIVSGDIFDYPRAVHWTDAASLPGDSPNPTAALVGLLRHQEVSHPWLSRATDWCWQRLERPMRDAHEIRCAATFLEFAPDRSRAERMAHQVGKWTDAADWFLKEPDPKKYGLTPLDMCPHPDAITRAAFSDDALNAHLEALASRQQDDGGWPITWEAPSPGAEMEWRGRVTVEALATLRAWKRI